MVFIAGEKIIGIDIGTTGCAAAVLEGGSPTLVPSSEGRSVAGKSFPSYVAFDEKGEKLVGAGAKERASNHPGDVIKAVKREMGTARKFREFTPQEITASILSKIKSDAEEGLGASVEKAVITVPASFNENQRSATKDAAEIAGLDVLRIINEPIACGLAYCFENDIQGEKIMVFDLGGGFLDVAIMELAGGAIRVLSTAGDATVGGIEMDEAIAAYAAGKFREENGVDITGDGNAMGRLVEAAEAAKIELTSVEETEINVPFIAISDGEKRHLNVTLTREALAGLVAPVVEACSVPVKKALRDANLESSNIDRVILAGGPTKMPVVHDFIKSFMGIEPSEDIEATECVAAGAAIQGGILVGGVADIPYLDVLPHSFGIETGGGNFTALITRNTTVPARKTQVFTTAVDNQTSVDIHMLQGEGETARENVSLGHVQLVDIPPAAGGAPQIEVTFDIGVDGLLRVSARDLASGAKQKIKITAPHRVSKEDIKEKIRDAEFQSRLLEKDQKIRELETSLAEAKEELANKVDRLDNLESRLKSATESLTSREEKLAELEGSLKEASERLASREEKLAELESGLRSTSESIVNGGERLAELEERIKKEGELKAEIGERDRRIAELEEKVKAAEMPPPELAEKDEKIAELEEKIAELESMPRTDEGLEEKIAEKEKTIEELKIRMKETLDDLVGKEERLIEAESALDMAKGKIRDFELAVKTDEDLQAGIAERDAKIAELEEMLKSEEGMSQKLTEKDEKIEELKTNLRIANDSLASKEERLVELESSLKATSDNLIKREEKLIDLEKSIKTEDELVGRIQEKERRIVELELNLKSTTENLAKKEERLMELESSMKTAAENLDKKGEELLELEQRAKRTEELEAKLKSAEEELARKKKSIGELERKAMAAEGLKADLNGREKKIEELESKLKDAEGSLARKEEKLVELGESLKATTESLANREAQLSELGASLKSTSEHLESREKKLEQLEQKVKNTERDLERKNKELEKEEAEMTRQKQKYQKLIRKVEKESQQKHAEYEKKIKETDKRVEALTKEIEKTLGDLKK